MKSQSSQKQDNPEVRMGGGKESLKQKTKLILTWKFSS